MTSHTVESAPVLYMIAMHANAATPPHRRVFFSAQNASTAITTVIETVIIDGTPRSGCGYAESSLILPMTEGTGAPYAIGSACTICSVGSANVASSAGSAKPWKMAVLHIREFPDDLHLRLKRFALDDGVTLREVVIDLLSEGADRRDAGEQEGKTK